MNKKILIVDDDATNRKLLSIVLSKKPGIEVVEASNGSEALNKLTSDTAVVLLDIFMPIMNGIEFLKNLKMEKPELANIPVIILSTDDTKKEEALTWGATEFIVKPVNPDKLIESINMLVKKNREG